MGVHSNIAAMGRRSPAMGERKNMRAALLDTKGPEVRTGLLADGAKSITLLYWNLQGRAYCGGPSRRRPY